MPDDVAPTVPVDTAPAEPVAPPAVAPPAEAPAPEPAVAPEVTAIEAQIAGLKTEEAALESTQPATSLGRYLCKVGMDYHGKRAEAGDVVDDLPAESIPWLLSDGLIEPAQ